MAEPADETAEKVVATYELIERVPPSVSEDADETVLPNFGWFGCEFQQCSPFLADDMAWSLRTDP